MRHAAQITRMCCCAGDRGRPPTTKQFRLATAAQVSPQFNESQVKVLRVRQTLEAVVRLPELSVDDFTGVNETLLKNALVATTGHDAVAKILSKTASAGSLNVAFSLLTSADVVSSYDGTNASFWDVVRLAALLPASTIFLPFSTMAFSTAFDFSVQVRVPCVGATILNDIFGLNASTVASQGRQAARCATKFSKDNFGATVTEFVCVPWRMCGGTFGGFQYSCNCNPQYLEYGNGTRVRPPAEFSCWDACMTMHSNMFRNIKTTTRI